MKQDFSQVSWRNHECKETISSRRPRSITLRRFKLANLQAQAVLRQFPVDKADKELENLQDSIPHYYEKTVELITAPESSSKNGVLALLSWVFYSKTPVRKRQFSVALPVGEKCERTFNDVEKWLWGDEISSIVSASEGLVIEQDVGGTDDTLVFAHNTVRDFIQTTDSLPPSIDLIIETSIKFLQMSTTDLNELQILRLTDLHELQMMRRASSRHDDKVLRIGASDLEAVKSGALRCFQFLLY